MSLDSIPWDPWIDDISEIRESLANALKQLKLNNKHVESIDAVKVALHSIKGLFDSVGLKLSTQTIYELEESVHKSEGSLSKELISNLEKVVEKLDKIEGIITQKKPKRNEIEEIDKSIGFESILIKLSKKYKLEIEVKAEKTLRSARALGIINSIKRFAVIESSNPSEEDLFLDANFTLLSIVLSSHEDMDSIKTRVQKLPGLGLITIEELKKVEEDKNELDKFQDLTTRISLRDVRAIESSLAILSVHLEALKSEVTSGRGIEELNGIEKALEQIQINIRNIRKVPLDSIIATLPAMVRRLAQSEKKQAELYIQGRFITIDRALANQLIDPITQIIRNSVSHGIETVMERRKKKKPVIGKILFNASVERDRVIIKISDDGKGFQIDKLIKQAKEHNIPIDENLPEKELINLIFEKGLSTSEDKLSGRGIGLYVAKERIQRIGGYITAENNKDGPGITFTIEIPDPDALTKNIIFDIGSQRYAISSSNVDEIILVEGKNIKLIDNNSAEIEYKDRKIPIAILHKLLSDVDKNEFNEHEIILLTRGVESQVGILIDGIVDERLVNIKPLNYLMKNYELFNGSIIGQEREVIMVINPSTLA